MSEIQAKMNQLTDTQNGVMRPNLGFFILRKKNNEFENNAISENDITDLVYL